MDFLRTNMSLKAEPNDSRRKTPKLITVTWHRPRMQCPAQMVGPRVTSAPPLLAKQRARQELLQMERPR